MVRFLLLLVVAVVLAACGDSGGPAVSTVAKAPAAGGASDKAVPASGEAPAAAAAGSAATGAVGGDVAVAGTGRKRIVLVMKTLTNPFFVEMEKGARRAERELDIALQVKTAAQETSIEQQIQIVDDMIAAKVDAIVIAPGDSQRLVPVLKKAADASIKVVNIDNRLDPEAVRQVGMAPVPFISVDNEKGAYQAARYLVEGVAQPTDAVILEGIRSADNARQRMEGARRAFAGNRAIRVVAAETANWKIDEAYAVTREIFAKHPRVRIVFAANDMMALGAVKYLQEAGRGDVKVGGYDALDEAVAEVRNGRMAVTVDQQAAEQGYQGIAIATRLLKGETVPPVTLIETRLVTPGGAK